MVLQLPPAANGSDQLLTLLIESCADRIVARLAPQLAEQLRAAAPGPLLIGVAKTAERLDISEQQVRNLADQGLLPVVRGVLGTRVLFHLPTLERWLESQVQFAPEAPDMLPGALSVYRRQAATPIPSAAKRHA